MQQATECSRERKKVYTLKKERERERERERDRERDKKIKRGS